MGQIVTVEKIHPIAVHVLELFDSYSHYFVSYYT